MSTTADDAAGTDRVDAVTLDDGDVLVYDRDNEAAWIQTDTAVELDQAA